MKSTRTIRFALWGIVGLILSTCLTACDTVEKMTSTAGGGSSSQSMMTVKGAAR